jgi:YbbR domain-containing protein
MKMKNRLKKHSLKFISVLLSLFLWVYVLNSEKVKFEKSVTLEYILPPDMIFAERPVQEVVFMIEGPRAFVRTVSEREDKLVIDLNRANTRRQLRFNVDINPAQLNLPFGMVVETVLPRRLAMSLERKASKIVPVKLNFQGTLPPSLTLSKAELNYPEVEVYGPRSLITKLKEIQTKPIELETLVGTEELPVELSLPDERFTVMRASDLSLRYELQAISANFELKDVPISFLNQSQKIKSKITSVTLKLLVPEKILKNRSNLSSSVKVWADIPSTQTGRVEIPLRAILPPGIHLLEISPKTIFVDIQ